MAIDLVASMMLSPSTYVPIQRTLGRQALNEHDFTALQVPVIGSSLRDPEARDRP